MHDPFTDLEIKAKPEFYILEACRKCHPDIKVAFSSTRHYDVRADSKHAGF